MIAQIAIGLGHLHDN